MTVLRVVLSFAAVGGLLWLFARAARGRFGALLAGSAGNATAAPLVILDRRQLTRSTGVALLRAGTRHLLVGVGETGIQLLTEGDDLVAEPAAERSDPAPATTTPISLGQPEGLLLTDPQSARTRLPRASTPGRPRTSFVDALREKTVRRS